MVADTGEASLDGFGPESANGYGSISEAGASSLDLSCSLVFMC